MLTARLTPRLVVFTLIALAFVQCPAAFAWGNEGHTYINRVAAHKIPPSMPHFLRRAEDEIAYLGPEPDRWRNPAEFALKNAQEPDHFIDLERVSWLDPLPQGRYEFYRKLYEKRAASPDHADDYLPEHVGLQPYITMEVYGRLKAAFRAYRQQLAAHQSTAAVQQAIIFYAGWLGHYVADGSQPLHTTIHYNGWVGPNPNGYTTEHGIHAQFETAYVASNVTAKDFAARVKPPTRLAAPFADYVSYLKRSHDFVEEVYSLDEAGGFTGKGSPAAFQFTSERLAAGSQMLLDLWYTAWLESAEPATEQTPSAAGKVGQQWKPCADSYHQLSAEHTATALHSHLKRPQATILHLFRYTGEDMPVLKNIAAIAKGMSITFSEMFRPTIVENYPDGKGPLRGARIEARFRGAHVLQRDEHGLEKCVACFLCAAACPSNCIYIEAAENTAENRVSGAERYAKVYNIDYNRCIFCGYCVEACPTDAITHGHGFELATFNATNLVYRKEMMLAPRPAHMGANIVFNQADVNGGAPAEMVPGS